MASLNELNFEPFPSEYDKIDESVDVAKLEQILIERLEETHSLKEKGEILFTLGQISIQNKNYDKAWQFYERSCDDNIQSAYQLAVLSFDGAGDIIEKNYKLGYDLMLTVAKADYLLETQPKLLRAAQYNVGLACFQGYGVRRSDEEAEKWWLLAADDGSPDACVKAQSVLGLYYSCRDTMNLKKAYYWHNQACGNGDLESQVNKLPERAYLFLLFYRFSKTVSEVCLGVMLEQGLGTTKDTDKAFKCYKEATERKNLYAVGCLVACYYKRKMYTKCIELSSKYAQLSLPDIAEISRKTGSLPFFCHKGASLACFYYARCLQKGHGGKVDQNEADKYFSKSFQFDPDVCAKLQSMAQHGVI